MFIPTNMTKEEICKKLERGLYHSFGNEFYDSSLCKENLAELLTDIYQKLEAVGKADEPQKGEEEALIEKYIRIESQGASLYSVLTNIIKDYKNLNHE